MPENGCATSVPVSKANNLYRLYVLQTLELVLTYGWHRWGGGTPG